ncbi:MAG: hypothetical protein AAF974_04200 [Cyanobacteria bacterium P01_E01_bin.34]
MKRVLTTVALVVAGVSFSTLAQTSETQIISPNAHKVPYLGVDGAFILGGEETSRNDPRNPSRVVLDKMEFFSFYADVEGEEILAENCRYVYRGAAGDPFHYPDRSLGSIWDMFELRSADNGACEPFQYVVLRSPHGDPAHMHMRYGGTETNFSELLEISLLEENPENFNPWWSLYCEADTSLEDCYE